MVYTNLKRKSLKWFCLAATVFCMLLLQGCIFFRDFSVPDEQPAARALAVGDQVGGKTIVWVNTGSGSWTYLAMGIPSEPMPWDMDNSRHISTKSISSNIGDGKENSIFLKYEFASAGAKMRTAKNSAVTYCIDRGGWLPSRDEAEKMAQFTSKDFWTSHYEASSKAFYYSPLQRGLQSKWRNERDFVVAIPVYYLDARGNTVEPY